MYVPYNVHVLPGSVAVHANKLFLVLGGYTALNSTCFFLRYVGGGTAKIAFCLVMGMALAGSPDCYRM